MGNATSSPTVTIEAIRELGDAYEIRSELGSGKYATCFEAEARGAPGGSLPKVVAIKALYKNHKYYKKSRAELEVKAWQGLRHPSIVHLLAALEDPKAIWLVQELVGGSTMQQRIKSLGFIEEEAAMHMAGQMLSAVAYMHSMGVTHRDIKPANILMGSDDASSEDYERVKLCDFGLAHAGKAIVARPDPANAGHTMKTLCGSPSYLAPEVACHVIALQESRRSRRQSRAEGGEAVSPTTPEATYTCLVDVWSCGVLTYEMVSGSHPFSEWGDLLRGQIEFESPVWATASKAAIHFITHILVADPARRPTAAESLAHPWLTVTDGATYSRDSLREVGVPRSRLSFRQRVSTAMRSPLAGLSGSSQRKESLMRLPLTSRAWNEVDPSGGSISPIRASVRQSSPTRSHPFPARLPPSASVDSPMPSPMSPAVWGTGGRKESGTSMGRSVDGPMSPLGRDKGGPKAFGTQMRSSTPIQSPLQAAARSASCDGTLVRRIPTGHTPKNAVGRGTASRSRDHLPSLSPEQGPRTPSSANPWSVPDEAHREPESPSSPSRLRSLGLRVDVPSGILVRGHDSPIFWRRKMQGKGVGDSRADSSFEGKGSGDASVGGNGAGAAHAQRLEKRQSSPLRADSPKTHLKPIDPLPSGDRRTRE